jgi:hypothetical protein
VQIEEAAGCLLLVSSWLLITGQQLKKLWGTLFASPVLISLVSSYFFFFELDFFFEAFLVAMVSILPFDSSSSMCNDLLLQWLNV